MRTTWRESYKDFLEHSHASGKEVEESLASAIDIIEKLPPSLRADVIVEINEWGRDDFVIFNGYIDALQTTLNWLENRPLWR